MPHRRSRRVGPCPVYLKLYRKTFLKSSLEVWMIEPTKFLLFIGVSWALIIAPGPDMLYVITRGVSQGRIAGMLSAIGVVCGILVHTTAAALGLSLILQTSAIAFLIVKYIGAIYLIYLGIKAWQDKSAFNIETSTSR